jgi:hypothetical protein
VIAAPPDWTCHHGVQLLTLIPPDGGGRIRYWERLPLRGARALLEDLLARDAAYQVDLVGAPLRLATEEGEHAMWVPIRGSYEGATAARFVGIVFADEFAAALDTLVLVRDRRAFFERWSRELLLGVRFGLGDRLRRFFYAPPPGWQGLPSGLVATWYPPGYPADRTNLCVLPAEPGSDAPRARLDAYLAREAAAGFNLESAVDEERIATPSGLEGYRWSLRGRVRGSAKAWRDVIVCSCPRYAYTVRLETLGPERLLEHRATVRALLASAEPVPISGKRNPAFVDPGALVSVTGFWVD